MIAFYKGRNEVVKLLIEAEKNWAQNEEVVHLDNIIDYIQPFEYIINKMVYYYITSSKQIWYLNSMAGPPWWPPVEAAIKR